MKRLLFLLAGLFFCAAYSGAQQSRAKEVLDKLVASYQRSNGTLIEFSAKDYAGSQVQAASKGTVKLKGKRFLLETPEATTWFDGETQWSYLAGTEEVNLSLPSEDDLQHINPYALLYSYDKKFSLHIGANTHFGGKPVTEIVLKAFPHSEQGLQSISLYVSPSNKPVFMRLVRAGNEHTDITIVKYEEGKRYADALFAFDAKKHPDWEIIDLR